MATTKHPLGAPGGLAAAGSRFGDVRVNRAVVSVSLTRAANDLIYLCKFPAAHVFIDAILWASDMDTNGSPTIALDVGIVDTGYAAAGVADTSDDDAIFDGVTTAQAGGVVRPTLATAFNIASRDYERDVVLKIATGFATFAAGTLGLILITAPKAPNGLDAAIVAV